MISFTDYALAVYPFLELEWFHRTYYRVLEAFAEGRVRRLMISMPPQHGKSVGGRRCCRPICWDSIPICGSPSPPIRRRWRRSSTAACSASSARPNTANSFPTRRSSAARNRPNTSARPTKSRSWGTRAVCCRSAARVRSRATASTFSCSTTSIRMLWRPIRRSCARTAGSGTLRWCARGCTTTRASCWSSRAGTKRI